MARVKRSVTSRRYRKKVLKAASGYYGRAKNCYTVAIEKVEKGLQYNYRDRKNRKRTFRSLWIVRINAALRAIDQNLKYSNFMGMAAKSGVEINRKMLAHLAAEENEVFNSFVKNIVSSAK